MKNFTKIILLMGISLLLLIGCGSKKQDKTVDNFINKLLSVKTYEDITYLDDEDKEIDKSKENLDKYEDDLKTIFQKYFTEDGFENTILIPHLYYTVINKNNINDITDLKIVKTKESENDALKDYEFINYEYTVSYKLKSDDKSIDMTDYLIVKVMNNTSLIDEVSIDKEKSNIFTEFNNSRNIK